MRALLPRGARDVSIELAYCVGKPSGPERGSSSPLNHSTCGCQCPPSATWPRPSRISLPLKLATPPGRLDGSGRSPRFGIGPL